MIRLFKFGFSNHNRDNSMLMSVLFIYESLRKVRQPFLRILYIRIKNANVPFTVEIY
jgi:hypothetical protein